jgi:hypothetical protein
VPDTRGEIASELIDLSTLPDGVPPALEGTVFGAALARAFAELRSPAVQVAGFDNRL